MNGSAPTPEQLEAIRLRNLANLAERVRAGKTLSKGELATLEAEQTKAAIPAVQSQSQAEREAALATRWAANTRTIRRWKAEGAPLTNDEAMPAWLRSRRKIPAGTAALLAARPDDARSVTPPKGRGARVVVAVASGEEPVQGAAAALKRLEEDEARLWQQLCAMEADPGADSEEIGKVRKAWLQTGDSLRRYELAVEQSRRDAGQLLPRAELEEYAAGLIVNFGQSTKASLENLAGRLAGLDSPAAVWALLRPAWDKALTEALANSAARPYSGRECPKWLVMAVQKAMETHL
jgi:hypothetical protein